MEADSLPFITEGLPGTGGKVREKPGHFIVEEIPLYEPSGEGQHLYVNITKEGISTRDVQLELAKLFGLPAHGVGAAGLKDKHAVATQTFSVLLKGATEAEAREKLKGLSVKVNWSRLHRNKLRRGHLKGNRFTITITGLDDREGALRKAEATAGKLREGGLPNYYGPQRFGSSGENWRKGLELIQGKARERNRWLRKFLISSYQSHLCNLYLAGRVEKGLFYTILKGDIAKKHDTGGLFLVEDEKEAQARFGSKEISFTAPMYGPGMRQAEGVPGELEESILEQSGVTMEQLGKAKVEGTRRPGRLLVPDLEVKQSKEGLIITFSLPKGSFATTVLREVMKA